MFIIKKQIWRSFLKNWTSFGYDQTSVSIKNCCFLIDLLKTSEFESDSDDDELDAPITNNEDDDGTGDDTIDSTDEEEEQTDQVESSYEEELQDDEVGTSDDEEEQQNDDTVDDTDNWSSETNKNLSLTID